jgi:hypothetical protein
MPAASIEMPPTTLPIFPPIWADAGAAPSSRATVARIAGPARLPATARILRLAFMCNLAWLGIGREPVKC